MKFDVRNIKEKARKNFGEAWLETAKLLPAESGRDYSGGRGSEHMLHALVNEVRAIFLSLGFDEVENNIFVPEEEVYWQYGPEAPVILDRCYYLAGLPRPDIGLGKLEIEKILEINPDIKVEKVQGILRGYRQGSIEGDDLFEEMVKVLGIRTEDAARIINIFPAFKDLTAVAEKMTLRSHMTAAWFPTLKALSHKQEMPIKLFSTGLRFRREQKLDATHLRAHYGASCVVMDPEISLGAGKEITEKMLEKLEFRNIRFEKKKATSNYYAPGTELEAYSGTIEVADCGMYSPVALANYDIEYPVFNVGFGLERILMIREGKKDVREILYPQFYGEFKLSDGEIAADIAIEKRPRTEEGKKIASMIAKVGREKAEEDSPCSFPVYEGPLLGRDVKVSIIEKEDATRLLGPAALNDIYVYDGSVYGIPKDPGKLRKELTDVRDKGVRPGFDFLDAVSNYFAFEIENTLGEGEKEGFFQIKMAKNPSDVNICVSDVARRYITSRNKEISIRGPVFVSVQFFVR